MLVTNADGSQTRTDYTYDGTSLVAESTVNRVDSGQAWSSTPIVATYLMGASGPMYRKVQGSPDVRWYVADGLGSVVGEVDVNGVKQTSVRDVYGLLRNTGGGAQTSRQGFVGQSCGHITDPETGGLVYMRARYYDPLIGRFESEDSVAIGSNWFIYCNDNPINLADVTGKAGEVIDYQLLQNIVSLFNKAGLPMDAEFCLATLSNMNTETALTMILERINNFVSNPLFEGLYEAYRAEYTAGKIKLGAGEDVEDYRTVAKIGAGSATKAEIFLNLINLRETIYSALGDL